MFANNGSLFLYSVLATNPDDSDDEHDDRVDPESLDVKHFVCAICNRAECDGMSCDVMSCVGQYAQNEAAMTAESNSLKAEIEEYKHKCEGCDCKREGCDYFLQSSCWA